MPAYPSRESIVSLLRRDPLRHIVTLKMLDMHGEAMKSRYAEDADGWGLLSTFPPELSDFDRAAYPDTQFVALVDGTSRACKLGLLHSLPLARVVVKSSDEFVAEYLLNRFHARRARSFVSFTSAPGETAHPAPTGVADSGVLDAEVARLIANNGYQSSELEHHFARGARWFGAGRDGRFVSVCFVFGNFDTVWEIGGVYTEPAWRRQGLARSVVIAALRFLLGGGRVPRYQVRSDNLESIGLARAVGLREFLRVDHFVVSLEEGVPGACP